MITEIIINNYLEDGKALINVSLMQYLWKMVRQ